MSFYKIPSERVVYEVLAFEVILIDFNTGNYYALVNVAKQIWQMIERHMSLNQIAEAVSSRYGRSYESIRLDLENFFQQLLDHGLIQQVDSLEATVDSGELSWEEEYEPPKLQEYTDVQSLLLLDPIHEAAEAGWPEKPV